MDIEFPLLGWSLEPSHQNEILLKVEGVQTSLSILVTESGCELVEPQKDQLAPIFMEKRMKPELFFDVKIQLFSLYRPCRNTDIIS